MKPSTARIHYVEDDADTRELVTMVLGAENFQVIATESHNEALRLAQAEPFDLFLIDNWMPGVSGVGLCEQLREFDQHTPVLFYSGVGDQADIERALATGAQGYLVKPQSGDELATEVLRLILESRNTQAVGVRTA
jgi:DNA-binding response OmpR family regulator